MSHCNHKGAYKETREAGESEWCNRTEIQPAIFGFEDENRTGAKEWRQSLETGTDKEIDSSVEPPEGTQLFWHLDFYSVRPILGFWPPELHDNKFVLF